MRIVALEPLGISAAEFQELAKPLVAAGHEVVAFADRVEDNAVLMERAKDADVLLLTSLPLAGEVIRSVPNLQLISVAFTGVDHIDMATCRELGIIVCNSSGYATHAVAELAFGFMIAVMRFMLPCDAATRAGKTRAGLIGNELFGKTSESSARQDRPAGGGIGSGPSAAVCWSVTRLRGKKRSSWAQNMFLLMS